MIDTGLEVWKLMITARSENCLKSAGIKTIYQLARSSEQSLLAIPNLGRKSLRELKDALAEHGLHLGMKNPPPHWHNPWFEFSL